MFLRSLLLLNFLSGMNWMEWRSLLELAAHDFQEMLRPMNVTWRWICMNGCTVPCDLQCVGRAISLCSVAGRTRVFISVSGNFWESPLLGKVRLPFLPRNIWNKNMFVEGVVKHWKTSLQKSSKSHGIAAVFDIQVTFQILRSDLCSDQ